MAVVGITGTEFWVPDFENVRVVRDIDVYWGGGLSGSPSVHVIGSAGQTFFEAHEPSTGGPPPIDSYTWAWRGRQVFPPGATFAITSSGPAIDATVSGYTLRP
jgi:hypothetical protein